MVLLAGIRLININKSAYLYTKNLLDYVWRTDPAWDKGKDVKTYKYVIELDDL